MLFLRKKRVIIPLAILSLTILLLAYAVVSANTHDYSHKIDTSYSGDYWINNVTFSYEDSPHHLRTVDVYIKDGMINTILPANDGEIDHPKIVDGRGRFLFPGLIDSHVHIFDPKETLLYLSHGITTVRNMSGLPMHLELKAALASGEASGPRLITTTPAINAGDNTGPFHFVLSDDKDVAEQVKRLIHQGYDQIKTYNGLSEQQLKQINDFASDNRLVVSGHPIKSVPFSNENARLASVEHIEEVFQMVMQYTYNEDIKEKVTQYLIDNNITLSTTLIAYFHHYFASVEGQDFLKRVDEDYLNSFTNFVGQKQLQDYFDGGEFEWDRKKSEVLKRLTVHFAEKGVSMAIATDTGPVLTMPGRSYFDELTLMASWGISNSILLKSATRQNAKVLGNPHSENLLAEGAAADFLILDQNPYNDLESLRAPAMVSVSGNLYDKAQLNEMRQEGKKSSSLWAIIGFLLQGL